MDKSLHAKKRWLFPGPEQEVLAWKWPLLERAMSLSVGRIRKSVASRSSQRERTWDQPGGSSFSTTSVRVST